MQYKFLSERGQEIPAHLLLRRHGAPLGFAACLSKNVRDAFFAIYAIERTLPRRRPTISRWAGFYMANTDKWYYAYTIEGDTITVVDACHAQNMHD